MYHAAIRKDEARFSVNQPAKVAALGVDTLLGDAAELHISTNFFFFF